MQRKYTNYENLKFKKKVSNFKWIANTFLAGAVSGAITLGIMQGLSGCKDKGLVNKINEPNAVVQRVEKDVNEQEISKIIDYKTENFENDSDKILLARMIYGEARNCNDNEKIAVAFTAINRANDGKKWNGETINEVILKPWQYSCFNKGDLNYNKLKDPVGNHEKYFRKNKEIFENCLKIAEDVLNGKYSELNKGQTHYFNPNVVHPSWADKIEKIGKINNSKHEFYIEK